MDISKYICQAKELGVFSNNELKLITQSLTESICFDYCSCEPDNEDWIVLSKNNGEMCLIHTKLKLIFTNIIHLPQIDINVIVLNFDRYSEKKWSIDLQTIDKLDTVFNWHTNSIDTSCFSTQELYYATV